MALMNAIKPRTEKFINSNTFIAIVFMFQLDCFRREPENGQVILEECKAQLQNFQPLFSFFFFFFKKKNKGEKITCVYLLQGLKWSRLRALLLSRFAISSSFRPMKWAESSSCGFLTKLVFAVIENKLNASSASVRLRFSRILLFRI
jgi:hypothetical protein